MYVEGEAEAERARERERERESERKRFFALDGDFVCIYVSREGVKERESE